LNAGGNPAGFFIFPRNPEAPGGSFVPLHSIPEAAMPSYNSQNPPYAIFAGDLAFAFNAENPAANTSSQQFSLPDLTGFPDQGRTIRWQTLFSSAPTSVNIALQTAEQDVDAQYAAVDSSTNTAGEARTVTSVRAKFIRAKVTAISGGSGVTVLILT
jgi:hypothetical protein